MNQVRSEHILVAETEPQDALLLQLAFQRAGIQNPIDVVTTGEQVIEFLRGAGQFADRSTHPLPIAIILALPMPLRNGFNTLCWIRRQPQFRHIRVTVLSGIEFDDERPIAEQLGADCYEVKPTNFADLVRIAHQIRESCLAPLARAA